MSKIDIMCCDKTGTLTNMTSVVTNTLIDTDHHSIKFHEIVGAIENESTHPLARALTNFSLETLKQDKFSVDVTKMKTISGKGVIGTVNNEEWFVGKEYMTENNSNPFYGTKATELANE